MLWIVLQDLEFLPFRLKSKIVVGSHRSPPQERSNSDISDRKGISQHVFPFPLSGSKACNISMAFMRLSIGFLRESTSNTTRRNMVKKVSTKKRAAAR
jgi:hypothetical protein